MTRTRLALVGHTAIIAALVGTVVAVHAVSPSRHVPLPATDTATSAPPSEPPLIVPATNIGAAIIGGNISQAIGHGSRYLAIRAPRGTLVRICAATCLVLASTDYGPSSRIRPARIADLALGLWLRVCGKPASAGICKGSVEFLGRVPVLPPTDAVR